MNGNTVEHAKGAIRLSDINNGLKGNTSHYTVQTNSQPSIDSQVVS